MEIKMMRVLEITGVESSEEHTKSELLKGCGKLESEAELIIYNGRVLKNVHGATYS